MAQKHFNSLREAALSPDAVQTLALSDTSDLLDNLDVFATLPLLKELSLSEIEVESLPVEICQVSTLKIFEMRRCRIGAFPPEIQGLRSVHRMEIWWHQGPLEIPEEFGNLFALKKLYLCCSQVAEFPAAFCRLAGLNELHLDINHLTSLPPEIAGMKKLKKLKLERNRLTSLPPEIGKLKGLKQLDVAKNQLTELPDEIGALTKMEWMRAEENAAPLPNPERPSPWVRFQLKRLKAKLKPATAPSPLRVPTIVGERVVPEAIRQLLQDVVWSDKVQVVQKDKDFPYEVDFGQMEVVEEYIKESERPWYSLAYNDYQYFYFLDLATLRPWDPAIYLVDHEGMDYTPRAQALSKWLAGMKTVKKPKG
jgi:hypothetical protein